LVLGYEVPKYEGDLLPPNAYVALDEQVLARKVALILEQFGSQRGRTWFDAETFRGLARIRGIESGGGARYAEAFHVSKLVLSVAGSPESTAAQTSEPSGEQRAGHGT
jgi:hypothetical protein